MAKRNFANVFAAPSVRRSRHRKVIENALLRGGLLRFGARNSALAYITSGGKLCRQCPDNAGRRRVQFAGLKSVVVDGQTANNSNSKECTILSHMQIRETDHVAHLRVLISQNPLRNLKTSLAACWRRDVPPLEPEPSIKMRH